MTGNEKASQKRGFNIYIQIGEKIFSQHVYRSQLDMFFCPFLLKKHNIRAPACGFSQLFTDVCVFFPNFVATLCFFV